MNTLAQQNKEDYYINQLRDNTRMLIKSKYFINHKLKLCSNNSKTLINKCFEEAKPFKDREQTMRFMEIILSVRPVSTLGYYLFTIFGGYKKI